MWVEEANNGKFKFCERYTDYMTGKLKRVSVTMDKNTPQTRKTAQKTLELKIQQAMKTAPNHQYTLKELIEEYRKDQKVTVKQSTYSRNYFACNAIMKMLGESTIVEHMTAKYVRNRFRDSGKENSTLNEHLTRFKALIRWGYSNDMLSDITFLDKIEPFKDVPHKQKIQDKYLESNELKALLNGMDHSLWRLCTEFMALSGLRVGELIALDRSDVDFKNKVIHVTKNYDYINQIVTSPKSFCSIRDVYMQEELENVCKQLNALMLRRRLMSNIGKPALFLFSRNGTYIHYYSYNKYLRENSKRVLGRAITPHALRHTHASLLLEQGISIDTISRRLGHEKQQGYQRNILTCHKKAHGERQRTDCKSIYFLKLPLFCPFY